MRLLIVFLAAGALPLAAMAQPGQLSARDCIVASGVDSGDARVESKCKQDVDVAWCVRGGGGAAQRCPTGGGAETLRPGGSLRVQWVGKGALEFGACFVPHRTVRVSSAGRFECRHN